LAVDPLVLLVAAVSIVLARYGEEQPMIAIAPDTAPAGRAVVAIPVDESATAAGHLAETARLVGSALSARPPAQTPAADDTARDAYVLAESLTSPADDEDGTPLRLMLDTGAGRQLACRYRTELADETAVRWMLHCLRNVLAGLERHADRPIGEIDLVTDGHPEPMLPGEHEPAALDAGRTLHGMVTEQAARRPDAIAVVSGDHGLTYRELDQAADRLAAGLRHRNVGHGSRVGVLMDRSHLLIVALLGVLKAGAAYVPLLPDYPPARLAFLAADAPVAAIVTDAGWPAGSGQPDMPVIHLSDQVLGGSGQVPGGSDWTPGGDLPGGNPASAQEDPDGDAYLLYTSGSTGEPKGVVVTHSNVASLLDATRRLGFGTRTDDIWTFFASYAWDFSVFEVFGCLTTGGRLVVVPTQVTRDPEEMHKLLRKHRVTVLCQTPSAFANLLAADAGEPREPGEPGQLAVRLLILGGEQLDMGMMLRWFARYPEDGCRVMNMYGPTEATIFSTCLPVTMETALGGGLSIGSAIPGWQVDVVDGCGRRVPPGVHGEIFIGGPGVAAGYHNRPGLTARRFFVRGGGSRTACWWYRTGDRARVLPDGSVEFLGRSDDQVKIRGYRVELGEIKAALLADPSVRAAAVVPSRPGPGNRVASLDAYVVGPAADPQALRKWLRVTLPPHMMPGTVTVLDALPVTRNGKLDVSRLPAPRPVSAADTDGAGFRPAERQIAALWEEVLGIPVGPDDNLFLVGGNSLNAFEIVVKLRAAGLGPLTVRDLYRNSTIRALAAKLTADWPQRALAGGGTGG
jgi:amino acid adenylation domain-containing protein